jgi:hypothetical protein
MTPSKNEWLFVTRNIAKAFFELDLSNPGPPTTSKTPDLHDDARANAPRPSTTNDPKEGRNNRFLTLPAEIRLQIYEKLLISRFDRTQNPSWAVGDTSQKLILLHMIRAPQYRTMEPGVLQACKQIHQEANSILYSKNIFYITEPAQMFRLVVQTGLGNFLLIKTLHIWVPCMAEPSEWVQLLHILAENASGLRYIEIGFGTDLERMYERGLGDNPDFVRALGKIRGLDELVIKGYYAEHWPKYLEKRMGVRVRALCGHYREEREPQVENLNDEELEDERYVREQNERELQAFRRYQQGIEEWAL